MNLDELLYRLPLIGWIVRRLYSYFKRHTALTDFFHVLVGLGIGLMITGGVFFQWGILALLLGILFHFYALSRGE